MTAPHAVTPERPSLVARSPADGNAILGAPVLYWTISTAVSMALYWGAYVLTKLWTNRFWAFSVAYWLGAGTTAGSYLIYRWLR